MHVCAVVDDGRRSASAEREQKEKLGSLLLLASWAGSALLLLAWLWGCGVISYD